MVKKSKIIIGWEEWCSLPDLGLPAIKAKIDTGAKTSALHAYGMKVRTVDGVKHITFKIHPVQGNSDIEHICTAPLIDQRSITSSNGEREKRYVIATPITCGGQTIHAELTLTSRHNMAFRMLLGREALKKAKFVVDSSKAFTQGKVKNAASLYKNDQDA